MTEHTDIDDLVKRLEALVDAPIHNDLDYIRAADDLMTEAARGLTSERVRMEKALAGERRRATDAEYMNAAFRNMLGPVGLKVAEMWAERGVRRVHFDWGPEARDMTGEERAQFIIDFENAPRKPLDFADGEIARAIKGDE